MQIVGEAILFIRNNQSRYYYLKDYSGIKIMRVLLKTNMNLIS